MKTLWLAACVAVIALSAAGCRRESADGQAKGFDANVDPVSAPLAAEPSPDILADQTVISRKAKEARSAAPAPAPAASSRPAPAASGPATSAPAAKPAAGPEAVPASGDANAPKAPADGAAPAAAPAAPATE